MKPVKSIIILLCVAASIVACDKNDLDEDTSIIIDIDNEPALLFGDDFETLDTSRWHFHTDHHSNIKTALSPNGCGENYSLNVYAENSKGNYGEGSYGATSVAYVDLWNLHYLDSISTDFSYLFLAGLFAKFELEIRHSGPVSNLIDTSFVSQGCDTMSYSLPIDVTDADTVRVKFTLMAESIEGGQLRIDDLFIYGMMENSSSR